MTESLEAFVRAAAERAGRLFDKSGEVCPMMHYVNRDGANVVTTVPMMEGKKDLSAAMIRALLELDGATRCALIGEGWVLDKSSETSPEDFERITREGVAAQPGCVEVLMVNGEDQREGVLLGTMEIVRAEGRRPRLGELKLMPMGRSKGTLIGLLPATGTRQ